MPEILELSALELAAAIRRRQLTSRAIVEAHASRLRQLEPRINAVVGERFEQAVGEATAVDQRIAKAALRGGEDLDSSPLLGVPFTVVESIAVAGMPNSAGVAARGDYRPRQSATVVARLIDSGAIPLAVTNTSELALWIETDNPLYGRTSNPYDPSRTAGGSSGGEAAAIGAGGSPFGVGADIGGSIRLPALFCGVFGHKPSSGLVPNTGIWPPIRREGARLLGVGPLTRRAGDLMPLLHLIAGPDGKDMSVASMKLGDPATVSLDGLQVTTIDDGSSLPISRDLRDARERAVGALVAAGATRRRVSLPSWRRAILPYLAVLQDALGTDTSSLLAGAGERSHRLRDLVRDPRSHTPPTWITLGLERISGLVAGEGSARRQQLLESAQALTDGLREAIGDGVLVHPAHPTPAPRHNRTLARPWLMAPTALFDLAGVPVTEVPLGLGESGLPVGVQVAARSGADHIAIAIALELEAVFGGWVPPPAL